MAINSGLIQNIAKEIQIVEEPEISFPQADSFERVINLCGLLNEKKEGFLTRDEITKNYDIVPRQANYCTGAGRYLGLIEKSKDNGKTNYFLNGLGKRVFSLNAHGRQIEFIKLILSHRVFNRVVKSYFENYEKLGKGAIVEIMKTSGLFKIKSEKTFRRRADTISSWSDWIIGKDWGIKNQKQF